MLNTSDVTSYGLITKLNGEKTETKIGLLVVSGKAARESRVLEK